VEKLKNIGAGLILAGVAVGVIGVNVGRTNVWVEHYFPAIMFLCLLLPGGLIGATGMIGVAIQKRRNRKVKAASS
jgi:hypothetical protein